METKEECLLRLKREHDVSLSVDGDGVWFFDGPAGCGPKHVRTSGRGPYWRGEVTPQFAAVLIRKMREVMAQQGTVQP